MKTILDFAAQQMVLGNLQDDLSLLLGERRRIQSQINKKKEAIKEQQKRILDPNDESFGFGLS